MGCAPLMDWFRHHIFLFHVPWRPRHNPCLRLHHEMYLLCLLIAVVARSPFKSLTPEVLLGGRGYSVRGSTIIMMKMAGMGDDDFEIIRVNWLTGYLDKPPCLSTNTETAMLLFWKFAENVQLNLDNYTLSHTQYLKVCQFNTITQYTNTCFVDFGAPLTQPRFPPTDRCLLNFMC